MDLTTRREGEGAIGAVPFNGSEPAHEVVNGSDGCDVTTPEVTSARKSSAFSIRNLMGGEDSNQAADGNSGNDGKCFIGTENRLK